LEESNDLAASANKALEEKEGMIQELQKDTRRLQQRGSKGQAALHETQEKFQKQMAKLKQQGENALSNQEAEKNREIEKLQAEATAAGKKAEGEKADFIEKYKALSDKKLHKAKEAMEMAKNKITALQKKLDTVKKEEERLRIREKKVVQALQRAREVISSMKKR
jgi:chromosome segregation ATPase